MKNIQTSTQPAFKTRKNSGQKKQALFYGKKIGNRVAQKLDYKQLISSCDIGLSTVIIKKSVLKPNTLFPNLTTKEDYVFWLMLAKDGLKMHGLNQTLTRFINNILLV